MTFEQQFKQILDIAIECLALVLGPATQQAHLTTAGGSGHPVLAALNATSLVLGLRWVVWGAATECRGDLQGKQQCTAANGTSRQYARPLIFFEYSGVALTTEEQCHLFDLPIKTGMLPPADSRALRNQDRPMPHHRNKQLRANRRSRNGEAGFFSNDGIDDLRSGIKHYVGKLKSPRVYQ